MITNEHYRDFLGTIDATLEEIRKEFEIVEDGLEYMSLSNREGNLILAKEYFSNEEVWEAFTKEKLADFINNMKECCKKMSEQSRWYCDDFGVLHGITEKEWDRFERERLALSTQLRIWQTFYEFCNGEEL